MTPELASVFGLAVAMYYAPFIIGNSNGNITLVLDLLLDLMVFSKLSPEITDLSSLMAAFEKLIELIGHHHIFISNELDHVSDHFPYSKELFVNYPPLSVCSTPLLRIRSCIWSDC